VILCAVSSGFSVRILKGPKYKPWCTALAAYCLLAPRLMNSKRFQATGAHYMSGDTHPIHLLHPKGSTLLVLNTYLFTRVVPGAGQCCTFLGLARELRPKLIFHVVCSKTQIFGPSPSCGLIRAFVLVPKRRLQGVNMDTVLASGRLTCASCEDLPSEVRAASQACMHIVLNVLLATSSKSLLLAGLDP
jgi:hypothetical protein